MKRVSIAKLVSLVSFTLLVACESESASVGIKLEAMSFAGSEWSEPVNLAAINTGAADAQANLSPDELSLYFQSDRDRKSTRLNSSHGYISYAVFCLKKKKTLHDRS